MLDKAFARFDCLDGPILHFSITAIANGLRNMASYKVCPAKKMS